VPLSDLEIILTNVCVCMMYVTHDLGDSSFKKVCIHYMMVYIDIYEAYVAFSSRSFPSQITNSKNIKNTIVSRLVFVDTEEWDTSRGVCIGSRLRSNQSSFRIH
jgi:hypothetical protein